MKRVRVRHLKDSNPAQFCVVREDGNESDPVTVPAPRSFPIEGRPNSDLLSELRWYLEDFLHYPFHPETDRAERVQTALKEWGQQAFEALFGSGRGRDYLRDATAQAGHKSLNLQIASDDAQILSWPWEALEDPETGTLAHLCQIERRINSVSDPLPLSHELPKGRVNILLVTARPFERDVAFRSISRPLVELVAEEGFPADITLLRPPTFDQLQKELDANPNHYHVLHFDGHGGYGEGPPENPHALKGPQGRLIFEDANGEPDKQTAENLATLLRQYQIPAVVLNACQSGMIDEQAADPFASVAAALLKAGIRSVVAMSYVLYVSAAQEFLPDFYRNLFTTGDFTAATRRGRRKLLQNPDRICARGRFPLQDWLVPVNYQQDQLHLDFSTAVDDVAMKATADVDELVNDQSPYGFFGRDRAILQLERALHRPPSVLLVHGLGGVGKTTLAHGFAQWLIDTKGLDPGALFWFRFDEIRTAEFVINRIVERLFGTDALTAPMDEKIKAIADVGRQQRLLFVFDNFEVVYGIDDTSVKPLLSTECRNVLQKLIEALRGTKTKIVMTSRSDEDWLTSRFRYKVQLGGLQGEERWRFCETILREQAIQVDRNDPDLQELMNDLEGHPLAMQVILPHLEKRSAAQLRRQLRENPASFGDGTENKLFTTLKLAEEALPDAWMPILEMLSLHERFADGDYLEAMFKQVTIDVDRTTIDRCLRSLCGLGVLTDRGQAIMEIHPLLTRYLRSTRTENSDNIRTSFVKFMAALADHYAAKQHHEQRFIFHLHYNNFLAALQSADELQLADDSAALTQSLAAYAKNNRDYSVAFELFEKLGENRERQGDLSGEAGAYHQLGIIAQEQRAFSQAESWYQKSLAIKEKQGNEHGAASTYHQLGKIAEEQRDFSQAEAWYQKSLAIFEKQGNEHSAASTYHQLGIIAAEQRDFSQAEAWYQKSLAIKEKQGNEYGAASTYGQLGLLTQREEKFLESAQWLIKSLLVFLAMDDQHFASFTIKNARDAFQQATSAEQLQIQQAWDDAGLSQIPLIDETSEEQSEDEAT